MYGSGSCLDVKGEFRGTPEPIDIFAALAAGGRNGTSEPVRVREGLTRPVKEDSWIPAIHMYGASLDTDPGDGDVCADRDQSQGEDSSHRCSRPYGGASQRKLCFVFVYFKFAHAARIYHER